MCSHENNNTLCYNGSTGAYISEVAHPLSPAWLVFATPVIPDPGTITGKVNLEEFTGSPGDVLVKVQLWNLNGTTTQRTKKVIPDGGGQFTIGNIDTGIYSLAINTGHWLQRTSQVMVRERTTSAP